MKKYFSVNLVDAYIKNRKKNHFIWLGFFTLLSLNSGLNLAIANSDTASVQKKRLNIFKPQPTTTFNRIDFQELSNFQYDQSQFQSFEPPSPPQQQLNFISAIQQAVLRSPEIGQKLSILGGQNANIDVAKSQYYPQISGGIGTGDLGSSQRGRQILQLSAKQLIYDFGKVKSSVSTEQAKLIFEQANVLISLDDIAFQTSNAIINIERYRKNIEISEQQIQGIQHILDIAKLRARAGISSQADPIQAESYLQSAQSSLITQQSLFQQYQQQLSILLGFDVTDKVWSIPEQLVQSSDLYSEPSFNIIPQMIAAHAEVEVAKLQKKQVDLSRYPTLALKATASQALNGINPSNNKDNGFDHSIMLEAESNFYQGGATSSRSRSASYAEQAALAKVNSVYLDINERIRVIRQTIENKQRQMLVLAARQSTTIQTRELYQEQYKLGTRSLLDLLNAEMGIHSAVSELENARYDIYSSLAQYIASTGKSRSAYELNHISIQGFEVQP